MTAKHRRFPEVQEAIDAMRTRIENLVAEIPDDPQLRALYKQIVAQDDHNILVGDVLSNGEEVLGFDEHGIIVRRPRP